MNFFSIACTCIFSLISFSIHTEELFKVIILGSEGGVNESNVSGYLIAPKDSNNFVALDGGSLLNGIFLANQNHCFDDIEMDPKSLFQKELDIFRNNIKAYLISHAHLDHVAGLVLNSTEDIPKSIFGIDSAIDFLRDHLFNWKIWPNFGSEGEPPILNQYQYERLQLQKTISIPNTEMSIEPFLLSHSRNYKSSGFLIESSGSYVFYFGDTAADLLEPEKLMSQVWKRLAPLVLENKLKGVFLECTYPDRKSDQLFGHLDAKHMIQELRNFAAIVDPIYPEKALEGLKILVTHMKEPLLKKGPSKTDIIYELEKLNDLGVVFIYPSQGEKIYL